MASFQEKSDEKGFWYTATGDGAATVLLHRYDKVGASPFTVFWHGRTSFEQLQTFVDPFFAQGVWTAFRAITFSGDGVDHRPPNPGRLLPQLGKSLSLDTRFIRLECFHGDSNQIFGPAATLKPSAIFWSRLNLGNIPSGKLAPDEIGACLDLEQLAKIENGLSNFISQTHTPKIGVVEALDCLHTLAQHLPPDHVTTYA